MGKNGSVVAIRRSPVPLGNGGAVMSVINQVLANQNVRIALASYIEGRGLPGDWRLEIQSARLVPLDTPSPIGDST